MSNEDRLFADPHKGLYLISDGMGGLADGAMAAQIVIDELPGLITERLKSVDGLTGARPRERVRSALSDLNAQVRRMGARVRGGIGATVVVAVIRGSQALIAHLGDSRAYLLRQRRFERLTSDHSVAELLIRSGEISVEEAAEHPARAQLTRYVGMSGDAVADVRAIKLFPGDRLLLCSDGLTSMLNQRHIRTILLEERDPAVACQRLIAAANTAGGSDNVSVITVDR